MLQTKKKKVTETYEETVAIICDSCGRKSPTPDGWAEGGGYGQDEITITRTKGFNFPEGGQNETFTVDLCPDCFENKFVKWLDSEGINGRKTESDW